MGATPGAGDGLEEAPAPIARPEISYYESQLADHHCEEDLIAVIKNRGESQIVSSLNDAKWVCPTQLYAEDSGPGHSFLHHQALDPTSENFTKFHNPASTLIYLHGYDSLPNFIPTSGTVYLDYIIVWLPAAEITGLYESLFGLPPVDEQAVDKSQSPFEFTRARKSFCASGDCGVSY
jgi:hypothetical protein